MSTQPAQADSNRLLAALSYPIWIIALVIVLTEMKKDAFMRHHGWTALFWGIAWVALWVAISILAAIPFIGLGLAILFPFLGLAWLILSIYYAVQAYNGKTFSIPVVSDFAKKYAA
ncbi:MAG: DUF4870 domain-containing protein [bacterium]